MKSPDGIKISSFLSTIPIKIFILNFCCKSEILISFNGLSFPTEIPISFTRPSAKVSTECANGYFNPLEISLAATNSGLITKSIPNTSFTKPDLEEYSGFLTRAIVYFAPIFFAKIQDIIFVSSLSVTEINTSLSATPASSKTS